MDEKLSTKKLIVAILLFIAGILLGIFTNRVALSFPKIVIQLMYVLPVTISYILVTKSIFYDIFTSIMHKEFFDEKFLMGIASIAAIIIGQISEGVAIMLFYQIGEKITDSASEKGEHALKSLADIIPDNATIIRKGKECTIQTSKIAKGATVVVRPGERIPCDGVVTSGQSFVDASSVTGESLPVKVVVGSKVFSGSLNMVGVLSYEVTKTSDLSTAQRIIKLVHENEAAKSRTASFITRFSKIYTPIVCLLALFVVLVPFIVSKVAPSVVPNMEWNKWIYRALMFLVVSCPCALVISVPLAPFLAITRLAKYGLVVKGSKVIEDLSSIKVVAFDKTGTLTKGTFKVTGVHPNGNTQADLVMLATHANKFSSHPIAMSLRKAHHCKQCDAVSPENISEIAGCGVRACLDATGGSETVLVGNDKLMAENAIPIPECPLEHAGTTIHVASENTYLGHILISDEERDEAKNAIKSLKAAGVKKIAMITGDKKSVADAVANSLGIDTVFAECLPEAKVAAIEELHKTGGVIFTGDGINDAPVLSKADVGIAMGSHGLDAAKEVSGVVILNDDLGKVAILLRAAKKAMRIITENIVFSVAIKVAIMVFSALGITNMWVAIFGDVGVSILAILNALRCAR